MLRLIFTLLAFVALLFTGAAWLVARPSGREVRDVMAPVLERGFELAGEAGRRVALTPTSSGVWEPEPEPATAPSPKSQVAGGPPAGTARAADPEVEEPAESGQEVPLAEGSEPEDVEIVPWSERPFVESPPEAPGTEPPPEREVAALFQDQDAWAGLIRRMLAIHARVSGAE